MDIEMIRKMKPGQKLSGDVVVYRLEFGWSVDSVQCASPYEVMLIVRDVMGIHPAAQIPGEWVIS